MRMRVVEDGQNKPRDMIPSTPPGGRPGLTRSPKLSAFAPGTSEGAVPNDFFDDLDELYGAARAMLDRWDEARSLRSAFNARVADQEAGGDVFETRDRMEHVGRVHAAVAATVDAFDVFMQEVAEGPTPDVSEDSLLDQYGAMIHQGRREPIHPEL